MDELLSSAGLSTFTEQLASAGLNSIDAIARASEEELMAAGLKKMHVNKLKKALPQTQTAPSLVESPTEQVDFEAKVR